MKSFTYLLTLCFIAISFSIMGQVGSYKLKPKKEKPVRKMNPINTTVKELNISFSKAILCMMGPSNDIEKALNSADFGIDRRTIGGGSIPYPITEESFEIYDFEATYYFTQHRGIALEYSEVYQSTIIGNNVGGIIFGEFGGELTLITLVTAASLKYIVSYYKVANFYAGPSLVYHKTNKTGKVKLGVNIGGSLKLVNKKNWFLGLKSEYLWAPNSTIGPYSNTITNNINNTSYVKDFDEAEISLQSFNIGLSFGIKLLQKSQDKKQ